MIAVRSWPRPDATTLGVRGFGPSRASGSVPSTMAAEPTLGPARGASSRDARSSRRQKRSQEREAVGGAEQLMARPLRMGHQAHHVAPLAADAGDVVLRTVRVVDVAKHDAIVSPQRGEGVRAARGLALEKVERGAQQ